MNPSHDLQGLKKKAKETFLYALSALFLGIAIGAIDAVFGRVLLFITDFRSAHVVVLLPFLPLAGLGICLLYTSCTAMQTFQVKTRGQMCRNIPCVWKKTKIKWRF